MSDGEARKPPVDETDEAAGSMTNRGIKREKRKLDYNHPGRKVNGPKNPKRLSVPPPRLNVVNPESSAREATASTAQFIDFLTAPENPLSEEDRCRRRVTGGRSQNWWEDWQQDVEDTEQAFREMKEVDMSGISNFLVDAISQEPMVDAVMAIPKSHPGATVRAMHAHIYSTRSLLAWFRANAAGIARDPNTRLEIDQLHKDPRTRAEVNKYVARMRREQQITEEEHAEREEDGTEEECDQNSADEYVENVEQCAVDATAIVLSSDEEDGPTENHSGTDNATVIVLSSDDDDVVPAPDSLEALNARYRQ